MSCTVKAGVRYLFPPACGIMSVRVYCIYFEYVAQRDSTNSPAGRQGRLLLGIVHEERLPHIVAHDRYTLSFLITDLR